MVSDSFFLLRDTEGWILDGAVELGYAILHILLLKRRHGCCHIVTVCVKGSINRIHCLREGVELFMPIAFSCKDEIAEEMFGAEFSLANNSHNCTAIKKCEPTVLL